jgi:hypothetical protein
VAGITDDVNDTATGFFPLHHPDDFPGQDKRGSDIYRKQKIPKLHGRVFNGSSARKTGGIDQPLNAAKLLIAYLHNPAAIRFDGQISLDEFTGTTDIKYFTGGRFSILSVTTTNHDSLRPAIGKMKGDAFA